MSFDDVDAGAAGGSPVLQVVVDRVQLGDGDETCASGSPTRSRRRISKAAAPPGRVSSRPVGSRSSRRSSHLFSERFECRTCGIAYEDPQPRLFSFNNPFGACPTCHGFGNIIELDMNLVVPDPSKSIQQGAIEPWTKPHYRAQLAELKRAAKKHKFASTCRGRI